MILVLESPIRYATCVKAGERPRFTIIGTKIGAIIPHFAEAEPIKRFKKAEIITNAIISGDADTFKSVPGIGPKTARRIIAELSDAKLISDESVPSYQNEALLALEALGFKREKIVKILPECKSENTSDLIKEALKKLG